MSVLVNWYNLSKYSGYGSISIVYNLFPFIHNSDTLTTESYCLLHLIDNWDNL